MSGMSSKVMEVVVRDFTMLLPVRDGATVSSITQDALQEYSTFNLNTAPKKVLYAKDSKGRVLSSALTLPVPSLMDNCIEIVVEDYSEKDILAPTECERLFRDWQRWAIKQLKDHVQHLTFREHPLSPDTQVMSFLTELSKSPDEDIQIAALRVFRLILSKCTEKEVIIASAEWISRMFVTTQSAEVAITALESFKDLSPLQLKLFDSGKYVKAMIDVNKHLTRFSSEVQSKLFHAFESILSLIDDDELKGILQQKQIEDDSSDLQKPSVDSWIQILQDQTASPSPDKAASSSAAVLSKGMNVGRVQSLLESEDVKIRRYGLEKLKRNLKSMHENNDGIKKTEPPQGSLLEEVASDGTNTNTEHGLIDKPAVSSNSFKHEQEVEVLVKALFQCMKNSIQARPKKQKPQDRDQSSVATVSSDATTKLSHHNPTAGIAAAGSQSAVGTQVFGETSTAASKMSMAGKLITTAFQSSDTDRQTVLLCMDCLQLIFTLPIDIEEGEICRKAHIKNRKINPLTAKRLSNIQKVVMFIGRDWYRLLFTLSHVDEATSDPTFTDLAEKAANLFSMTIIHGMKQGWAASALQLEKAALVKFLFVQTPTYRLYMALTYLTHLAAVSRVSDQKSKVLDPSQTELVSLQPGKNRAVDSLTVDVLGDILAHNKFMLLKSLWWWSIGERSNFLIRRMSLKCIAQTTVSSSFAQFLWKLDPMPRLLEILSRSFLPKASSNVVGFLQKEKHDESNHHSLYDDEEASIYSDTYYGDSDQSDDEDHGHNINVIDRSGGIKPDVKLIRVILKTMVNLVQASTLQIFSQNNRIQLIQYLQELQIGAESEGSKGISVEEVSRRDRVVEVYYSILIEQATVPSSSK